MKENLHGFKLTSNPTPGMKPTAKCENGYAALEGFSIQAGNGLGMALFAARDYQWRFVRFVDGDTAGQVDACVGYPYEFRSMLQEVINCPTFDEPNR